MLGTLYRLVDGRTECKTAGCAAGRPIKDVMGYSRAGSATNAENGPAEETENAENLVGWATASRPGPVLVREGDGFARLKDQCPPPSGVHPPGCTGRTLRTGDRPAA